MKKTGGFSDQFQSSVDAMRASKHSGAENKHYKSEIATHGGKIPYKTLAERERELSAEDQVRLTKPCVPIEYFGDRINRKGFEKGNLLNSGINLKSMQCADARSHIVVPVYIDVDQATSSSLEPLIKQQGLQPGPRNNIRNAFPRVFSTDKLEEQKGTFKASPH